MCARGRGGVLARGRPVGRLLRLGLRSASLAAAREDTAAPPRTLVHRADDPLPPTYASSGHEGADEPRGRDRRTQPIAALRAGSRYGSTNAPDGDGGGGQSGRSSRRRIASAATVAALPGSPATFVSSNGSFCSWYSSISSVTSSLYFHG